MMKNGRPYSHENGYIDDALITNRPDHERETVRKWIKENILRSRTIHRGWTSYGLKHLLENDTGIYLTNNEFKDAMLMEGYTPIDQNELNWRYRMKLRRETNTNRSAFFRWARKYEKDDSPYGDFARDMVSDMDFPRKSDHSVIMRYLERIACRDAIDVFRRMWVDFENR